MVLIFSTTGGDGMKLDKNKSIFCWLPSLMSIKYKKGKALVLAWGFYTLVLKDTEMEARR